jgi:hypothetical protein
VKCLRRGTDFAARYIRAQGLSERWPSVKSMNIEDLKSTLLTLFIVESADGYEAQGGIGVQKNL